MTAAKLPDTWATRDFPVLVAIASALDRAPGRPVKVSSLVGLPPQLSPNDVIAAAVALDGVFVEGKSVLRGGQGLYTAMRLTERGRRAVGLWPEDDPLEALITALQEAAQQAHDPQDRSRLQNIAKSITEVSSEVMAGVVTAVITSQAGLG